MDKLTQVDLTRVVSHIPRDVRELVKNRGLMIGGGFIRSIVSREEVHDIDIFGPTAEALHRVASELMDIMRNGNKGLTKKHVTPNAVTVVSMGRVTVQFITRWLYMNMSDLASSFDFTICKAVIRFSNVSSQWESVVDPNFYPDLAAKRLVYTFPQRNEDAGGSMLRAIKFIKRGYHIPLDSLAGVMARLMGSIAVSKDWTEKQMADAVEKRLVEVDPQFTLDGTDVIHRHD